MSKGRNEFTFEVIISIQSKYSISSILLLANDDITSKMLYLIQSHSNRSLDEKQRYSEAILFLIMYRILIEPIVIASLVKSSHSMLICFSK